MGKEELKKKEEQDETIPQFEGDGIETTKVTTLKEKVKLSLDRLRDMATMEIMLPSHVRMQHRLESIQKMASAESFKVDGHWKTNPPSMNIMGLQGRKLNNNECEIRFGVYEQDEKGNKKLYTHYADVELGDGSKIKRPISAEYKIAYEVIERIAFRKPIEREIIKVLEGAQ